MKVEDIRPDALMDGQRLAEAKDIAWLAERRQSFVEVPCPACGAAHGQPLYEKNGMPFVRCPDCAMQYASPRPDVGTLEGFYAASENYAYFSKVIFPASSEKRQQMFRARARRVMDIMAVQGLKGGTLLEVGAAYGFFCDEVHRAGIFDRIIAVEPTPDLAARCRSLGLETIESPYEKVTLDAQVDVIAHFEVIEHLFDPSHFLRWCAGALVPGGIMILTCPNIAGLETVTAGAASSAVDHEHINLFSPASLSRLLEKCGFETLEVKTTGELDIDLLNRALREGRLDGAAVNPIIHGLVTASADIQQRFLALLQDAGLTSNMMVVARKAG